MIPPVGAPRTAPKQLKSLVGTEHLVGMAVHPDCDLKGRPGDHGAGETLQDT